MGAAAPGMNPFDRRARWSVRWFTWPVAAVAIPGAFFVVQYGIWILHPPLSWVARAWVVSLAAMGAGIVEMELRARRGMKTLAGITSGSLQPTRANLQEAVAEVHAAPDRLFASRTVRWAVLGVALGVLVFWRSRWTAAGTSVRVGMLGCFAGLLFSVVGHFPMVARVRGIIAQTAARGLDAEQLTQVIRVGKFRLRARLMAYGLILAALPAVLLADAATSFAADHMKAVAAVEDARAREASVEADIGQLRIEVFILAAVVVAAAAFVSAALGRSVAEPLVRLADRASAAAEGTISSEDAVVSEGEVWLVSAALTRLQAHLARMVGQFRRAGAQISDTTEQILLTSSKHEAGAARQSTALAQTSLTTETLAQSAKSIAANAGEVAQIAARTLESAQQARGDAFTFADAMGRMRNGNEAVAQAVQELNSRVGQIGKIVEFINSIADKSDLLALNAELEGVKAGAVGESFNLVATEMRRMAQNVTQSTREIEELIDQIREATSAAVKATEAGVRATEGSSGIVDSFSQRLSTIVELAGHTSDAVKTISTATHQQQAGTDQLAEAMSDILAVTKETEAATQAIIIANVDLVRLAQEIRTAVEGFRSGPPTSGGASS